MNDEQKRIIANLEFAYHTCFWFMRGYYWKRLQKAKDKQLESSTQHTNLDLCYAHRQERNHSHFSKHNCHYCIAQDQLMAAAVTIRNQTKF